MTIRKIWSKPTLDIVPMKLAQAGSFSTNDLQHTHRS